ncbi:C-glycoside deglycosidase beta subunit domain-containing protein [Streptomyces sp. BH106]|uniref:C-glycoside deglycosidase beta subunit domain-containing protein n=1 Tax=Streptomyces sp. BH106 TaxID=3410409 RepID=UPI003CEAE63E
MFDQYIVCDDHGIRPRPDGRPGGVVEVRMPYYRGLFLSMVEAVDLTLDGTPVPAARTTFTVHGNTYTFDRMPQVTDDRWEMGERAQLAFETDQPLDDGEHTVTVAVRLRISYMPVPGGGRCTKTLALVR